MRFLYLQPKRTINKVLLEAEVAQLVEHDLAKVGVAGSSPVFRSEISRLKREFFFGCPGGGIGRHAGLKILWPEMAVRVQVPPRVLIIPDVAHHGHGGAHTKTSTSRASLTRRIPHCIGILELYKFFPD